MMTAEEWERILIKFEIWFVLEFLRFTVTYIKLAKRLDSETKQI